MTGHFSLEPQPRAVCMWEVVLLMQRKRGRLGPVQ